jgi:hypothetical protein
MSKERIFYVFEQHEPKTPMSKSETEIFLKLLMTEDKEFSVDINEINKENDVYKHFKPLIESFQAQVFLKRLEILTKLHITLGALIILLQYFKTPAVSVAYAFYLHKKLPPNTPITVNTMGDVFPWGFFSEQQFNIIWSTLKIKSTDAIDEWHCYGAPDNLLDYAEPWEKKVEVNPLLN